MSEKILNNVRYILKHDTEENWEKASNFSPKNGEPIIYDIDSAHSKQRLKIGDGSTNVNNLPFIGNDGLLESIKYVSESDLSSEENLDASYQYCITDFLSYDDLDSDLQAKIDRATLVDTKLDKVSTTVSDGRTRFYAIQPDGSQVTWYADTYDLTPYLLPLRTDSGDIIVPLTPGNDSCATSKKYVDDGFVPKITDTGGNYYVYGYHNSKQESYQVAAGIIAHAVVSRFDNGDVLVPATPTSNEGATSKQYVDNAVKNIPDTSIKWSTTTSLANDVSPVDAAAANCLSANRLAFGPAPGITVEYSNDGGSTWTDYGLTDEQKINLISLPSSAGPVLGHKSSGFTTNDQLRITLDASTLGIYTQARKLLVNFTTESASCYMKMETQLYNTEEWVTKDTFVIGGYSGWNSFPMDFAFGGNNSWGKHYVRLTFTMTALGGGSNAAQVIALYLIGDTFWSTPSNMAYSGHLYKYDSDQNMIVPHIIYQNDTAVIDTIKNSTETFTTRDGSVTIPDYVKQKTNTDGLYHFYAFGTNQTDVGGDSGPSPRTVAIRDENARLKTNDPETYYDAANKNYVDNKFSSISIPVLTDLTYVSSLGGTATVRASKVGCLVQIYLYIDLQSYSIEDMTINIPESIYPINDFSLSTSERMNGGALLIGGGSDGSVDNIGISYSSATSAATIKVSNIPDSFMDISMMIQYCTSNTNALA